MFPQTLQDLARLIQLAIGPVVLVSGVGLILLTMTNRFGRIIDRGRRVVDMLDETIDPSRREPLRDQLGVLRRQARLMRTAVSLIVLAVLLVALVILLMFAGAELGSIAVRVSTVLFGLAIVAIVVAMAFFLREITLSTAAHDLELQRSTGEWPAVGPVSGRTPPATRK